MTGPRVRVEPWEGPLPSKEEIVERFSSEGLSPTSWSNAPGDRYGEHSHSYHKVLYCTRGSITFESLGSQFQLLPGDRLEIPPDTPHSAIVGPEGVTCLEAARNV